MNRPPDVLSPLDLRRAVVRTTVGALSGLAVAGFVSLFARFSLALLAGWDAGGLVLLSLAWANIAPAGARATRARASAEDPGRTAVYVLVIATSAISLLASTVLVRSAKGAPPLESRTLIALCLTAVALSWVLTHTAFTLRYAHLYYREDKEGVGGVEFPGQGEPTYLDFAYLAFTVGMCFQVSDTCVTSRQIRRAVLLQALLSFFYNTAILAFVLNLAFGFAL